MLSREIDSRNVYLLMRALKEFCPGIKGIPADKWVRTGDTTETMNQHSIRKRNGQNISFKIIIEDNLNRYV